MCSTKELEAAVLSTHDEFNVFVEILAGGGELLGGRVLKVPQLVLHPVVELVRVLLALQVELAANGSVLKKKNNN